MTEIATASVARCNGESSFARLYMEAAYNLLDSYEDDFFKMQTETDELKHTLRMQHTEAASNNRLAYYEEGFTKQQAEINELKHTLRKCDLDKLLLHCYKVIRDRQIRDQQAKLDETSAQITRLHARLNWYIKEQEAENKLDDDYDELFSELMEQDEMQFCTSDLFSLHFFLFFFNHNFYLHKHFPWHSKIRGP